jgi:hypothetical protein
MRVGDYVVTLDDKPGTIREIRVRGPERLMMVELWGLEGTGLAPYLEEELRVNECEIGFTALTIDVWRYRDGKG